MRQYCEVKRCELNVVLCLTIGCDFYLTVCQHGQVACCAMMRTALTTLALLVTTSVAVAQLRPEDAPLAPNDTRCGLDCVRCAADGCVKCARLLVWPAGICSHSCPSGTRESWSHDDHLMGRICYPTHFHKELIVGGAGGGVLCIILIAGVGAWYARRRRAQQRPHPVPQRQHLGDDDARLREFHKQLDCLRPHSYTLLAILNHTRHQVRELYQLGNNDAAMAYSCILSDLAKLLILLNKQQVPVVPEEWPRLASWAERTLKRFNRMNENQQQEEFQIINFLPSPKPDSEIMHQSFTTFKPLSCSQTSCNSDDVEQERQTNDGRPPSYTQVEKERNREAIVLSVAWERPQIVRRESIWLEDELFEMMRRPQDELTTEL